MEHRRRTFSNVIDDLPIDIEKQVSRRRGTSASIDGTIDEHIDYVYNGSFSVTRMFFCGLLNLICPCRNHNRKPIEIN